MVEEGAPFISLKQGNVVFIVGVKSSTEEMNIFINRTESLEPQGNLMFMGQEVPRMVWIHEDRVLAVRYGDPVNMLDGGEIVVGDLTFTLSLWEFGDDWWNETDISTDVQVEVDQIIGSFELY